MIDSDARNQTGATAKNQKNVKRIDKIIEKHTNVNFKIINLNRVEYQRITLIINHVIVMLSKIVQ